MNGQKDSCCSFTVIIDRCTVGVKDEIKIVKVCSIIVFTSGTAPGARLPIHQLCMLGGQS